MKQQFWLYRRGRIFYLQDSESGQRKSLGTASHQEAERLRDARNDAARHPVFGMAMARAYLSTTDPKLTERTWTQVMEIFCSQGRASTQTRRQRAIRSQPFDLIRRKKLVTTTADDLRNVLGAGGAFTNHFLRCMHNLAVGLGWLPWPIIPPKLWPAVKPKPKRGITWEEHQRIIASEQNLERRNFYELLWEIGAAQTDTVELSGDNIDKERRVLSYQRKKTGEWAHLTIGSRLESLLHQLPGQGPLFPNLSRTTVSARAAEFCRRCRVAGIQGVSLHSYRYAWAERAKACGYPERFAQEALGHNSPAVHRAYARKAHVQLPALEEYERFLAERKIAPLPMVQEVAPVPAT